MPRHNCIRGFGAALLTVIALGACCVADEAPTSRRVLRVALYPYIPERAEMYWEVESTFEEAHCDVNLRFVDLAANYYGGDLLDAFQKARADVLEVDTVFLHDLVSAGMLEELPPALVPKEECLAVAKAAATINGKCYGAPHWVCGNFIYFRADDPERSRFEAVKSTRDLERILGRPSSDASAMLIDLRGKSTLGEKYLDALLDLHSTPSAALQIVNGGMLDEDAVRSLSRAFALCPGGLCDSEKHHESGQFYPRQFAERNARAFVGYSERMFFVVDHFLNGVREDAPSVGKIAFDENGDAIGTPDIDVVAATFGDKDSTMLTWVDVLCIRKGVSDAQRKDGIAFIQFAKSEELTAKMLIPGYGHAPRYLLPALKSIYANPKLLKAAPLYKRFDAIMQNGIAITGPQLNEKLRGIGGQIQAQGFSTNSQ